MIMAWRSSGTTNDEMVDNLKRYGVISSDALEQGFRNVDRRHFVPRGLENVAYKDQPLKEGNVHISAPHIYGSALEALELVPNSSISFLNVGSGAGYVSCIVADVLGSRSSHYGIEIHQDVVKHSKAAIEVWKRSTRSDTPHIEIIHGNGLEIDASRGEGVVGFDRIYVGAAVERRNLSKLTRLLRPGGILVGPADDELVKVVRIGSNQDAENFTQQVVSGVRFAPLLMFPRTVAVIPSTVWDPSIHQFYPDSFRASCKAVLLCSKSDLLQPQIQKPTINLAAMLPKVLWMEIMSYTHRSWFDSEQTEEVFLRQRLLEEQADAQRAHQARIEAEARCHALERERDVYRLLAQRWQNRLLYLLRHRGEEFSQGDQDQVAMIDDGDIDNMSAALDAINRRFGNDDNEDDDEDDHENDSEMDEADEDMLAEEAGEDSHDESEDDHYDVSFLSDSGTMDEDDEMETSASPTKAMASRPQVRTVSISNDDH